MIDTAGMRRKRGEHLEWVTTLRSMRAMSKSHIVCLVIDGIEGLVHQDLELASLAIQEGRGLMIAVNKCDEIDKDPKIYFDEIKYRLGEMMDIPILFISAKRGDNCKKIFPTLTSIFKKWSKRLTTSEVNKILDDAVRAHHPKSFRGHEVKIFYATQAKSSPPVFVVFTNQPKSIDNAYRRFLSKRFSNALGGGIPIRLQVRRRKK